MVATVYAVVILMSEEPVCSLEHTQQGSVTQPTSVILVSRAFGGWKDFWSWSKLGRRAFALFTEVTLSSTLWVYKKTAVCIFVFAVLAR